MAARTRRSWRDRQATGSRADCGASARLGMVVTWGICSEDGGDPR